MKIKDLPPGTKFLFATLEGGVEEHIGTVGEYICSCGCKLSDYNYKDEVYPILEWEDEL